MHPILRALAVSLVSGSAFAAPQMVTPLPGVAPKAAPASGLPAAAVRFNREALATLMPGTEVELTLPNGKRHAYVYEHTVNHGGGLSTWIARGAGVGDNGRAIVTTGPGATWGWMQTPWGEFRLYPGESHDWLAERMPAWYGPRGGGSDSVEAPPDDPAIAPLKGTPTYAFAEALQKSAFAKAAPTPAFQADVMFIYSRDIANKLGGGLLPMLYNLIASANQAYVDSEVALSLRLVYSMPLDLPNTAGSSDTLSSMAGGGTNAALFAPYTWNPDSVRNAVGADFVALVRDGPDDTGGIAFLLKNPTIYPAGPTVATSSAYSVNNFCASGCEGIFAHELGHNMGNAHDRATVARDNGGVVSGTNGVFNYSYGHYDCINGLTCNPFVAGGCPSTYAQCLNRQANDFGTIMAYVNPRVMKFSNPAVLCKPAGGADPGRACGLADSDDNARSMNNVRHNIAAYRTQTIASLPGSLQFTAAGYSGTEAGGTLTFTVSRVGGSSGAVSVTYSVGGGTATAGVDYTGGGGTLNWANGDTANKNFSVTLVNDGATEGPESIIATLSAPTGAAGVHLGHPTTAVGLIVEPWPAGGVLPAGFTAPASGAFGSWAPATDQVFEGTHSLRSPQVLGDGDFSTYYSADLVWSGTLAAGPVAFAYKVSSYEGYGFLEFIVDGVTVLSVGGEKGWSLFTYDIPSAGAHTLTWRYRNRLPGPCGGGWNPPPEGGAACADRGWIDAVSLPLPVTQFALNVSKVGTGTVTSNPAGIDCGATCSANFNSGTPVTLSAAAGTGFSFTGWSGSGCSGTGTCPVTMTEARSVTATFTAIPKSRGDVNGDGKSDLFWRTTAPGTGLSWWTMNGNQTVSTNYHDVGPEWQIADVGDLDGDGKADLVWRRPSDGASYLWLLDGFAFKGFADLGILDPATWSLAGIADLDGNGRDDVVWRASDGTVYGWLMNGGTIASQGVIVSPGAQWIIAALADMDGNGKADIVFRNVNDGGVFIYFMNGLAIASGTFVGIVDPAAWTIAGAADFSGDGKADILWRHITGDTWVWIMNGGAFVSAGGIGNPGVAWSVRAIGDYDGDGKVDLVWRHTDGTTYLWKMNGAAVSAFQPLLNPGGTWQVVAP